jgi:hypothetical protein
MLQSGGSNIWSRLSKMIRPRELRVGMESKCQLPMGSMSFGFQRSEAELMCRAVAVVGGMQDFLRHQQQIDGSATVGSV